MKIKTKRKLNLPELIQHVWDNEVYPSVWKSEESPSDEWTIQFFEDGMFRSYNGFHDYDTFTVEVEEIVTPITRFEELTEYIYDSNDNHHFTAKHKEANISMIIDCETHQFKTQAIYCKDTLIWSKEHGIPERGVLEVEVE